MSNRLVIVESPAKAKTINKYLGKGYTVLASYGHVRDLLPKEGAVLPDEDFKMIYQEIERNAKHVKNIVSSLKQCDELLLATDPDREGEAISYHIYELMKTYKALKDKPVKRVLFFEITKSAIIEAVENPRELSMEMVNAQQARRALDYLVGFNLSPLLWKKIRPGLSAGRVQSPALRMIVERELAIEAFNAQEYWTIEADIVKDGQSFKAKLSEFNKEKVKQFTFTNEKEATEAVAALKLTAALTTINIDKKQRKRNPSPPFTTSTLQQEASRKLGFGAQRTMKVAQQLYEGIDIGQGAVGLISYMRTDSLNLSAGSVDEMRQVIEQRYGKEDLPDEPRFYRTKSKNAQEAHEAIRPTSAAIIPDEIKKYLSDEQFKLYDLIWKRTIACQMIHASIDTVAIDFSCGEGHVLRANGSMVANPGFLKVYEEGQDDVSGKDGAEKMLPAIKMNEVLKYQDIAGFQHFTEPPPRYSEATLVKTLEEHGIGRPSTYATIISTLQQREYALLENKRFKPTDVGRIVTRFLTTYFTQYVDYGFTANLEDDLDAIARGEKDWKPLLRAFWDPFKALVVNIGETVQRKDVTQEAMDEVCPECAKPLSIRLGKRGRFVGCTGYPECKYTRSLEDGADAPPAVEVLEGRVCPDCQSELLIKKGKYGKFIGCSGYPKCKFIEPLEKPSDTGVTCPECKKGNLLKRKSRNGKIFFSCNTYPTCKYAIWNKPLAEPCPTCNWPITEVKVTKRNGTERVCPQKDCKFAEPYEDAEGENAATSATTDTSTASTLRTTKTATVTTKVEPTEKKKAGSTKTSTKKTTTKTSSATQKIKSTKTRGTKGKDETAVE